VARTATANDGLKVDRPIQVVKRDSLRNEKKCATDKRSEVRKPGDFRIVDPPNEGDTGLNPQPLLRGFFRKNFGDRFAM
jgi:hypothetical protein